MPDRLPCVYQKLTVVAVTKIRVKNNNGNIKHNNCVHPELWYIIILKIMHVPSSSTRINNNH